MKIKINLKLLMYIFLIIPFIKPYYFSGIDNINMFYNMWQILNAFIIIYLVREIKISPYNIMVLIIEGICIISTIINDANYFAAIINAIQVCVFCLILDYGLRCDCRNFIKAILIILESLVLINFFTIIRFENGMNLNGLNMWFLGRKNLHFSIIFPMIIFLFIDSYLDGKMKIQSIFMLIIATISIFLVNSTTSIIGILLVWVYIIAKEIINKNFIFNLNYYFIIYLILFLGIIMFNLQDKFSIIIENVFKKDISFTGRTKIWETAKELIKNKILLGYGNEGQEIRVLRFQNREAIHAHNMILDVLYQGGLVLLTCVIRLVDMIKNKLYKYKADELSKFFSWSILIYLIMWLTEVYSFENVFWVFVAFYNIDKIIEVKKRKNNECGNKI